MGASIRSESVVHFKVYAVRKLEQWLPIVLILILKFTKFLKLEHSGLGEILSQRVYRLNLRTLYIPSIIRIPMHLDLGVVSHKIAGYFFPGG